ncbi:MAG: hypothetical protein ACSLFE_03715 [Gemmatimonadaceae bacterium]
MRSRGKFFPLLAAIGALMGGGPATQSRGSPAPEIRRKREPLPRYRGSGYTVAADAYDRKKAKRKWPRRQKQRNRALARSRQ